MRTRRRSTTFSCLSAATSPSIAPRIAAQLQQSVFFFCESSLLRKTTVPYKGACSTQRQREEPRPRVTEGGRGAGEGDLGVGEGPGGGGGVGGGGEVSPLDPTS